MDDDEQREPHESADAARFVHGLLISQFVLMSSPMGSPVISSDHLEKVSEMVSEGNVQKRHKTELRRRPGEETE